MATLVIAGITVRVLEGTWRERKVRVGTSFRAFAGNLRSMVRAEKFEADFAGYPLTNTEWGTLETATALATQVAVSGDLPGGSMTCEVEIAEIGVLNTTTDDATGIMRLPAVTLREV